MKKITLLFLLCGFNLIAQQTLYTENFGSLNSGTSLKSITTYYAGIPPQTFQSPYPIVYSGDAFIYGITNAISNFSISGSTYVNANVNPSNNANSSGLGYMSLMTNYNVFKIENINTLNNNNITLSFGMRLGRNLNTYTNTLLLEQSTDGVVWTPISFLAPPPNQWALITCFTNLISHQFLKLRFTQVVTDTNGYGTISLDDIKVVGNSTLGVIDNDVNTIAVFPNPAHEQLTINMGNTISEAGMNARIINTLGQEVLKTNLSFPETTFSISTINQAGLYFVEVYNSSNNLVKSSKLIIQ
jgi:hypothetical protein